MDRSILSSPKVSPPKLPRIYPRRRLLKRLNENQEKRLCLVLGQAAQGKSTLAAAHLRHCRQTWSWLNIGPEDSDPVNLFYALAQALRPDISHSHLADLVERPYPAMAPRSEIPLYRGWVGSLLSLAQTPCLVVLDGLDRLEDGAPSFRFLEVFQEEAPEGMRLLLLSRAAPPFNLHDMKLRRQALIIDNDELAFTPNEIKGFFKTVCHVSLSNLDSIKIHRFTEGWAGGLILLSESLNKMPEKDRSNFPAQEMPDEFKQEFFQYFAENIFNSLPVKSRDYLLKASLFEVIDPKVMAELGMSSNGKGILEELSQRNVFVSSIHDEKHGVVFRLHQIFRDFLRSKLENEIGSDQLRIWAGRAGVLLEETGDLEQALVFYLQAENCGRAADIIHQLGFNLYLAGRIGDLARWIEALPGDIIDGDPWLTLYHCMTKRFGGGRKLLDRLMRTLTEFKRKKEMRGVLLTLNFLIEASIGGGLSWTRFIALLEESEDLQKSKAVEPYLYEKTLLSFMTGLAYTIRVNPRQGYSICRRACLQAIDLGDPLLISLALILAINATVFLGEFKEAEDMHDKLAVLLERYPFPYAKTYHLLTFGIELTYRGEEEQARKITRLAVSTSEKYGLFSNYNVGILHRLLCEAIFENVSEFEKTAELLMSLTSYNQDLFFQAMCRIALGVGYYRTGRWRKAWETTNQAVEAISGEEGRSEYHLHFAKLSRNLVACRLPGHPVRENEIWEALAYSRKISSTFMTADILLGLAVFNWRRGCREEVEPHLKEGFQLARRHGYRHFAVLSRTDTACACVLALELGLEEVREYVTALLTTNLADAAKPELDRLSRRSDPKAAAKAADIKRIIHRAGIPRLRITTLGDFLVQYGEKVIADKNWGGAQSQTLFKAILAHGPASVIKDRLMECLWPEDETDGQKKKFKVVFHRLRKALEPDLDKELGSSYLHLKGNTVCLDRELCQLDLAGFHSLITEGDRLKRRGEYKAALKKYYQAADIYRGDFLPYDLYTPWIQGKRDEIKTRYINLLLNMAKIHEDGATLTKAVSCYKKVLTADPCLEEACRRLMILYDRLGKPNMALNVYQDFRRALMDDLEVAPDELTRSIYERIREKG